MTASEETVVLVTGATGQAGVEVVRELLQREGVRVRAGVRTPEKARRLPPTVEVVPFDTERPATLDAALDGVDALFLLTPGGPPGPPATRAIVDAAANHRDRLRRVVRLSSLAPERQPQAPTDLWALETEAMVRELGVPHTILRPTWFFQNFSRGYFTPMVAQRALALPFGDGAAAWIDSRDIAAVAATALTEPGHEGATYTPTGPRLVTVAEIAAAMSEAAGVEIRYLPLDDEQWLAGCRAMGMPEMAARATLALLAKTRDGHTTDLTDDVLRVTGREPRSLETWARDHAADLRTLAEGGEV